MKTILKNTGQGRPGVKRRKSSDKETAEKYLKNRMKKNARGKTWEISDKLFIELIYAVCFYCKKEPYRTVNPAKDSGLVQFENCEITYNGIDRVDSSLGYVTSNVVTCCFRCNRAKSDFSQTDFIEWAKLIVSNFK
jgi:hypothetical protein